MTETKPAKQQRTEQRAVQRFDFKTEIAKPGVKKRFEEMLGKRAPSFISSVISAVNQNPLLQQCDPITIITSAAIAASMELPVNSSLGLAHIVPYWTKQGYKAQLQIGWKGFAQLALRSQQYKTFHVTQVYEGQIKRIDQFTGEMEFNQAATSDKIIGYCLYFKLLSGFEKYFYMTADQVRAHGKKYSQSFKKDKGLWVDDFDAMALKTVAKLGLSKYGMLSVEMQRAIESDQAEFGEDGQPRYVDNDGGAADRTYLTEQANNVDQKYLNASPTQHAEVQEAMNGTTNTDSQQTEENR